jgi:antirestriction protein ArdC
MNNDVYAEITAQIVLSLEIGVKPWERPWDAEVPFALPTNAMTGDRYHGLNILLLWQAQEALGFTGHRWATYRQAQELVAEVAKIEGCKIVKKERVRGKGHYFVNEEGQPLGGVRKGATGIQCLKYKPIEESKKGSDSGSSDDTEPHRFVLRRFTLFNTDQVDGLSGIDTSPQCVDLNAVETLFNNARAVIPVHHEGVKAYYCRDSDEIVLPDRSRFTELDDYYATRFHELVHAVGAPSRLARDKGHFGTPEYAFEELVAELGSIFLCANFGIKGTSELHENYIASWIQLLTEDKKAIQRAASLADKAATYILECFCHTTH